MVSSACPFCSLPAERIWFQTDTAIVFLDGFPVSPGHTLIIPKRHIASFMELPDKERQEIWNLAQRVRQLLKEKHNPDGFNFGVNEGTAAGQTVPHAHFHVIPRFNGDVPDPKGGVRWVVPAKAKYW